MVVDINQVREYFYSLSLPKYLCYDNTYMPPYTCIMNRHIGYKKGINSDINLLELEDERRRDLMLSNPESFVPDKKYPCFGDFLYYDIDEDDERDFTGEKFSYYRHVFIGRVYKKPIHSCSGNFTWLTKEQLEEHIDYCRRIFEIKYYVKIRELSDSFIILLDLCDLNLLQIKLLLFWTRYVIEAPSNLAIIDAYLLKDMYPEEEELYNLLILTSRYQYYFNSSAINTDQCISIFGSFITRKLLVEKIHSKEKYNNHVSCLFLRGGKNLDFDNSSPYKFNIGDVKICRGNNFNFKGWFSQEGLDDRFSIYSKLYDWYKNLEIK